MALGDFADLKTKACRSAHFNPSSSDDLSRAGEALNEAVQFVCAQNIEWDFMTKEGTGTVTASTDTYTYETIASLVGESADIEEVYSIFNDTEGGEELLGMDWLALERHALNTQESAEGTGNPYAYSQYNRTVRFYPSPDTGDTMRFLYKFRPTEMSADGDTPPVPLPFRMSCLVPYAAAILLEQEGGGEAMNDYERRMNRFEKAYLELRNAHGSARRPEFRVVEPSFGRQFPPTRRIGIDDG